jgi:D-alanyl-D-alanine carboxypeptidase/D-alanyl-D-alanine-endopeptidase (penicillin-binding protein 4)
MACTVEGKTVFSHRADELFLPASNQKLVTALAALELLGSGFAFETRFALQKGELVVEPCGDPCWRAGSEHDPARVFADVVAALQKAGVTAVRAVRVDAGGFVGPDRPESWPKDQWDQLYCAPTAGFVLEESSFRARLAAGDRGLASISVLAPPVELPIEGTIRVGTPPKGKRGGFSLVESGGKLHARGLLEPGKPREVSGLVEDPGATAALALRQALARGGIPERDDAEPRDLEPFVHRSTLLEALGPMLKESSNFHAEQLLRVLGRQKGGEGSFAAGRRVVEEFLEKGFGALPEGLELADGSGLSRDNRVTPTLLASVLRVIAARPYFDEVRTRLPAGGIDGTLDKRFKDKAVQGRVFAKTGYIKGVSALSGYVLGTDGVPIVFSILMNWDPQKGLVGDAKEIQQKIVECLARQAGG